MNTIVGGGSQRYLTERFTWCWIFSLQQQQRVDNFTIVVCAFKTQYTRRYFVALTLVEGRSQKEGLNVKKWFCLLVNKCETLMCDIGLEHLQYATTAVSRIIW